MKGVYIFNAFINLESVQISEDVCDMRRFRSFNHSACKSSESAGGDLFES